MTSPPVSDQPGGAPNPSFSTIPRLSGDGEEALSLHKASERLIQRFGGIRPMANKLEVPVTTVQGWKKRGAIPATRLNDLRLAAQRHGIALEETELDAVSRLEDRSSEPLRAVLPFEVPLPESEPEPEPEPELDSKPEPVATASSTPPALEPPVPMAPVAPNILAVAAARLAANAPQPSSNGRMMTLGPARLSLAAALVALIAAALAVWASPPAPQTASVASPADERRLGDLESKVSRVALEQDAQTTAINKQLSALDARLAQAASQKTSDELAVRIVALERALPALQQQVAAQGLGGSPGLAILLAATQLRAILATPNPFINELAAFRLTAFNDPTLNQSLEKISIRATAGIATEAWLIGRFSTVQENILRAATIGNPIAHVADGLLDVLSDWMPPVYHLTGVSQGASPRAIADRTRAWMAAGDFPRAVEQLGELTGLPAEVAAPWLAEARARVIADQIRTQLAKSMLSIAQAQGDVKK